MAYGLTGVGLSVASGDPSLMPKGAPVRILWRNRCFPPAKINSWSTSSTKDNFWQLPGRFWTPVQLIVMIYTLESIDQWFGKPRKDDNASIPMNCGKKMPHFHHKSMFAIDKEFMTMKQSIDFAVFSSHKNIHQLRELLLSKSYFAFLSVKS